MLMAMSLASAQTETPVPRIVVDEPHFKFGEQHNNQTIDHAFVIRNEGDATLEITNIRSTCGCTVGEVTSRSIPPGGTSKISGRYNLRGRRGTQRSVLTVETNDPNNPRTQLIMSGTALQELEVQPNRVFFGQVNGGQKESRQIQLIGQPNQPFEIRGIENESEHITVTARETGSSHKFHLDIALQAPRQPGTVDDFIRITTTLPSFPKVQVPVNARVAGVLTYAPNRISLLAGHQTPVTRYIVVRPGTQQQFRVTEVVPPSEDINVQVLSMPNQGYRIQLTNLLPSDDLIGRSVQIHTDVEGMKIIDIPVEIIETTN